MFAHVSMKRCFKSRIVAYRCLVQCDMHTFLHQSPNSVVNRT